MTRDCGMLRRLVCRPNQVTYGKTVRVGDSYKVVDSNRNAFVLIGVRLQLSRTVLQSLFIPELMKPQSI